MRLESATRKLPGFLRAIHWLIILNFLVEIVYGAAIIFFVLAPDGGGGPLASRAATLPFERMVPRRLYAEEVWIATTGLAIYLALTEFLPRQLRALGERS